MGYAELNKEQQAGMLDLIYTNQAIFLSDKDLGFCDQLYHTIPTTTDKLVYLSNKAVPCQFQEVSNITK